MRIQVLRNVTSLLAQFPNVGPDQAFRVLLDALEILQGGQPAVRIGKQEVSLESLQHCFWHNWTGDGSYRADPEGAALLIRLYESGDLPGMRAKPGGAIPRALKNYAASHDALMAKSAKQEAELVQKREAKATENQQKHQEHVAALQREQDELNAIADCPESIQESQFTYALLNRAFFRKLGKGPGDLEIGGLKVGKQVLRRTSNSGKSADWEVSFSWTGSDGQRKEISRESDYASNRRNDPDRNWGLPE